MPTYSEIETLLSDYAGNQNVFLTRLNLVRARAIQSGDWNGTKQQVELTVYADADGNSIVTLPRGHRTIRAGVIRSTDVLCSGQPLGVKHGYTEFGKGGLGYGGMTDDFQEVFGRFPVFREWTDPMRIRFKFERTESAGTIYVSGTLEGTDVWALNGVAWEKREGVAFVGTTSVTTTKYFDAYKFQVKKPATSGRVSIYTVDDDGVETLVGEGEPTETLIQRKRFKVAECEDVAAVESTSAETAPAQYYSIGEIQSLFADGGTITVSSATDSPHDLSFDPFFLKRVTIIAQAGVGTYTHKFTLDTTNPLNGAMMFVPMEIAASANPTLEFYNESAAGTLLQTFTPDSSNAQYITAVFQFNGTLWRYLGRQSL